MIIADSEQLQARLKTIKPVSIAVAYIGDNWLRYLGQPPGELIVSPTVGSNPKSIAEVIKRIGMDNVHFLDNLHAKIYLGKSKALVGSCNLSGGGFKDNEEMAVLVDGKKDLMDLRAAVAYYKALAMRAYPEAKDKKKRLQQLQEEWNSRPHQGSPTRPPKKAQSLNDYLKNPIDRVHVAWYQQEDNVRYNTERVHKSEPATRNAKDLDDYFPDLMYFHKSDDIRPGDWILSWHCRNNGLPRKDGAVEWMFVHTVIPNGIQDDTYTKLVATVCGAPIPLDPFALTQPVKARIRDCLESKSFPTLLSTDDETWLLKPADAAVQAFLGCAQGGHHRHKIEH